MNDPITIKYQPINKIIVNEIIKHDLTEFTEQITGNKDQILRWAAGLLIQIIPYLFSWSCYF